MTPGRHSSLAFRAPGICLYTLPAVYGVLKNDLLLSNHTDEINHGEILVTESYRASVDAARVYSHHLN